MLVRISKHTNIEVSPELKKKLLSWSQQFDQVVWLDSNSDHFSNTPKYSNFDCILAVGAENSILCNHKDAWEKLKEFQNDIKDYIFGYLAYDLKNDIEELTSEKIDGLNFSDLFFFQPKKIFFIENNEIKIAYLKKYHNELEKDLEEILSYKDVVADSSRKIHVKKRISKEQYYNKLENLLNHIHRGDIYEVNFCQEFYANKAILDPLKVYQKLNAISSPPFATFLKNKNTFLLSASPERFLKRQGTRIISQPIKGTARRSPNPLDDDKIARQLKEDPKERAENIMIVDLVRNDLSKTAIKGSVNVEELCQVYSFKQVHQLVSTLVSEIDISTNPVDIVKTLFPMGSMTGAPKISAMEIIEDVEETKRSLYSGAVGYFTPSGDFDFNVVIRSILYNQDNQYVSFSVGGAITSQSIIENEYEECLLKAQAMKKALDLSD